MLLRMTRLPEPLAGPVSRCWQADKRLHELKAELGAFLDETYSVSVEIDDEHWKRLILHASKPIPDAFGLLASEIGHHLRAGLNELVTDLCLLDTKGAVKKRARKDSSFPMYSDEKAYRTPRPRSGGSPTSPRDEYLACVSEPHRAVIDGYQPFNDPLIADLQAITNPDKHEGLEVGIVLPHSAQNTIRQHVDGTIQHMEFWFRDPGTWIKDGAMLFAVRPIPDPMAKVDMEGEIAFDVAFSERRITGQRLAAITRHVFQIIEGFRPDFA